jgi:hypothetical protein
MASNNYYQILGVAETATQEEIKKAYRKLARQFHPDVTQTPQAEELFKEVNRAYDILSDPLKRADFDATLHPTEERQKKEAPQPGTEEAYAWQPQAGAEETSGLSRISASAIVFLVGALILELFLRWLFPSIPISAPLLYIPGLVFGLIFGIMWGVDNNLDINGILGPSAWGRLYTFLRSILFTLTFVYFLSLVGAYLDYFLYDKIFFITPILGIVGAMMGATLGSTGETPVKLATQEGRFELFYTLLRGIEIGILSAIIGGLLGLIFIRLGYPLGVLFWGMYFGFIVGMIAGSINPSNLTAYASYVSASLKNVIITFLIFGALILGLIIGISFAETFKSIFGIIWESLTSLIGG